LNRYWIEFPNSAGAAGETEKRIARMLCEVLMDLGSTYSDDEIRALAERHPMEAIISNEFGAVRKLHKAPGQLELYIPPDAGPEEIRGWFARWMDVKRVFAQAAEAPVEEDITMINEASPKQLESVFLFLSHKYGASSVERWPKEVREAYNQRMKIG